jgi:hypothetical protein
MKPENPEQRIRDAAQYILEKRRSGRQWDKQADDHDMIQKKLARIERHLLAAVNELTSLQSDMRLGGRWWAFKDARRFLRKAKEQIGGALGPLSDAQGAAQRPPSTRAMKEQQTALRLAEEMVGATHPRKVRDIALRIMVEAGIQLPTPEAMTKWLRAIRKNI